MLKLNKKLKSAIKKKVKSGYSIPFIRNYYAPKCLDKKILSDYIIGYDNFLRKKIKIKRIIDKRIYKKDVFRRLTPKSNPRFKNSIFYLDDKGQVLIECYIPPSKDILTCYVSQKLWFLYKESLDDFSIKTLMFNKIAKYLKIRTDKVFIQNHGILQNKVNI